MKDDGAQRNTGFMPFLPPNAGRSEHYYALGQAGIIHRLGKDEGKSKEKP